MFDNNQTYKTNISWHISYTMSILLSKRFATIQHGLHQDLVTSASLLVNMALGPTLQDHAPLTQQMVSCLYIYVMQSQ